VTTVTVKLMQVEKNGAIGMVEQLFHPPRVAISMSDREVRNIPRGDFEKYSNARLVVNLQSEIDACWVAGGWWDSDDDTCSV
jgi:hypothetical protein